MKLFDTLVTAAMTTIALDFLTDGCVHESIKNKINHSSNDDFVQDLQSDVDEVTEYVDSMDCLVDDNGNKSVIMPIQDAINLYECIEEAITRLNPDNKNPSDYETFGKKALSFEILYDTIEDELFPDSGEETLSDIDDTIESINDAPDIDHDQF